MSIEQNKATMRKYIEGFLNKGDEAILVECVAETFAGQPTAGQAINSRQSHIDFFRRARSMSADMQFVTDGLVAEGDTVVAFGNWVGTHTGEWEGHAPTGKSFRAPVAAIYTFRDGMLVGGRIIGNRLAFYEQLGLAPKIEETAKR